MTHHVRRRTTGALAALMALLLSAACGNATDNSSPSNDAVTTQQQISSTEVTEAEPPSETAAEPDPSSETAAEAGTITVTDAAGRMMQIPSQVDRVLALHPIPTFVVWRLAGDRMVSKDMVFDGRYLKEDSIKAFTPEETARLAALPTTGVFFKGFDPEQVLGLEPDLIVSMTKDPGLDDEAEQTKIPVYAVSKDKLSDYQDMIVRLGEILGNEADAAELVDFWTTTLADVAAQVDQIPDDQRPRVYYANTGLVNTPGPETVMASIITLAGGTNVAAQVAGNPTDENIEVSMEQIHEWNPQVITAMNEADRQTILTDAKWKGIDAVDNGRVYAQLKYAAPDGINAIMGLEWLYGVLHHAGDAGYQAGFASDLRDFYDLFYRAQLTDEQIVEPQ